MTKPEAAWLISEKCPSLIHTPIVYLSTNRYKNATDFRDETSHFVFDEPWDILQQVDRILEVKAPNEAAAAAEEGMGGVNRSYIMVIFFIGSDLCRFLRCLIARKIKKWKAANPLKELGLVFIKVSNRFERSQHARFLALKACARSLLADQSDSIVSLLPAGCIWVQICAVSKKVVGKVWLCMWPDMVTTCRPVQCGSVNSSDSCGEMQALTVRATRGCAAKGLHAGPLPHACDFHVA